VTTLLGGDRYPTLPFALPCLRGIRTTLERPNFFDSEVAAVGDEPFVSSALQQLHCIRTAILGMFRARFTGMDEELLWVSYLDPRLVKMKHASDDEKHRAKALLLEALLVSTHQAQPHHPSSENALMLSPVPLPQEDQDDMHDLVFGSDEGMTTRRVSVDDSCRIEIEAYLNDAKEVNAKADPCVWWRAHRYKFPDLARLARKWLGTVATSVPSERLFSTSGNTITIRRAALSPDLVRDIVFVSENYDRKPNSMEPCI